MELKMSEIKNVEYTPYGETWIEKSSDISNMLPYKFTAKELDEETGLYYFGARYLNPRTSRWISSDPAGVDLVNPNRDGFSFIESQNWYSYVGNNPIKYIDPTGMWTKKMGGAVDNNLGQAYVPGKNDCDAWVENVVKEADSSSNLSSTWGTSGQNTAEDHKTKLKDKGLLNPKLKLGTNVAIQSGIKGAVHAMLVSLNPDGTVDVAQNTKNPEDKSKRDKMPGGYSETFSYKSEKDFVDDGWGELNFYSLGDEEDFQDGVYDQPKPLNDILSNPDKDRTK